MGLLMSIMSQEVSGGSLICELELGSLKVQMTERELTPGGGIYVRH
jgi:hypothetical protein